jgi:hypothetical protein
MKIKKIEQIDETKKNEKKENGLKVKTRLKAGPAEADVATCG